jgi:outer membrane protein assembly factor BamA
MPKLYRFHVWLPAWLAALFLAGGIGLASAQQREGQTGPVLNELILEGATVFSAEDVLWLLNLRKGDSMPGSPEDVAGLMQQRYESEGYAAAKVEASYDPASGRLTLRVDEGRIDEIEIQGLRPRLIEQFRARLDVHAGDVYNRRTVVRSVERLLAESQGALQLNQSALGLKTVAGRHVLVIPIEGRNGRVHFGSSSEAREDFFSPVDGFTPGLRLEITRFDQERFNHTFVGGYVSYKFSREKPGYSLGLEHRLFARPRVFAGVEVHDLSASDDIWRLSTTEQSLVALAFKNSFRDYYQRRGLQVFGAIRPQRTHELIVSFRRDRHENLVNETNYSFFRDDHEFPPNQQITAGSLRSVVIGYTFDSRGLPEGLEKTFAAHLLDDLYRANRRQAFGWRFDWTSEIAGHGLGGDYEFDRHIVNTRGYVPLSPRQSVVGRLMLGWSGGTVPIERQFALGGIGSVHGYRFKEAVGEEMALLNAEYRLDLLPTRADDNDSRFRLFAFFDAGRTSKPIGFTTTDWLKGTGFGVQTGPIRVEFGYRTDAIPKSLQVLVRLGPTF